MPPKIWSSAAQAIEASISDGMTIAVGGFGVSGIPSNLIEAVRDSGVRDLTIVSNNMGADGIGLSLLLETGQVRKILASYAGDNMLLSEQYFSGLVDIEFVPQGTLAERLRAGGAGIPAFYTPTGAGTSIAEGKDEREFAGVRAILEHGIIADVSLVRAHRADTAGNLRYRLTARNFNPLVATAGRITLVETEQLLDEFLEPDDIHTPGIFVQGIVVVKDRTKQIERRTVRSREGSAI